MERKSFTLIELLIVIAIILSEFSIPLQCEEKKKKKCQTLAAMGCRRQETDEPQRNIRSGVRHRNLG